MFAIVWFWNIFETLFANEGQIRKKINVAQINVVLINGFREVKISLFMNN